MDETSPEGKPPPAKVLAAALDLWNQSGSAHVFPITGSSMLPLLRSGDQIRVEHRRTAIRRGDLLVFRRAEGVVAHRVVRIVPGEGGRLTYHVMGDNALWLDAPVEAEELIGRATAIRRAGRELSLETIAWRVTGRIIAFEMLQLARLHSWRQDLQLKRGGSFLILIPAAVVRVLRVLCSLELKAVERLFGRWRVVVATA